MGQFPFGLGAGYMLFVIHRSWVQIPVRSNLKYVVNLGHFAVQDDTMYNFT